MTARYDVVNASKSGDYMVVYHDVEARAHRVDRHGMLGLYWQPRSWCSSHTANKGRAEPPESMQCKTVGENIGAADNRQNDGRQRIRQRVKGAAQERAPRGAGTRVVPPRSVNNYRCLCLSIGRQVCQSLSICSKVLH